jgi:eukaryotic-like serine/threonine-protein kinase
MDDTPSRPLVPTTDATMPTMGRVAEPGVTPTSPVAAPATGGWRVADRYRVVDRIGAGGMADVFRAHDELLARDVAVKVFRARTAPDTANGPERQRAELHALARLNHPNLITLFDGSTDDLDGPAYLIMELVEGPTLADRIAHGRLPEPEVRAIGSQIAEGLAYVHAAGMVHRDVKPANILLGADRVADSVTVRARLSDFGIVRMLGTESMTSVDLTLGTASYLAPEQAHGSGVGPEADVYSLGLSLIEALSGLRAFDGTAMEAVVARLNQDPEIPADLPAPWPSLLAAMTARNPADRPSAAQVAQLLRVGGTARPAVGDATTAALRTAVIAAAAAVPVATTTGSGAPIAAAAAMHPSPTDLSDVVYVDEPGRTARPRHRRLAGGLIAAALVLAAVAIASVLLFGSNSPSRSGTPTEQPALTHHATAGKHSSHAAADATGRPSTGAARTSSASRSAATTSAHTSSAPTTSAGTSSAPRTSSAPSTSQAVSSSAVSSAAGSTSAAADVPSGAVTG